MISVSVFFASGPFDIKMRHINYRDEISVRLFLEISNRDSSIEPRSRSKKERDLETEKYIWVKLNPNLKKKSESQTEGLFSF